MADSDLLAAVKALQTQVDNQTITVHQTLQQYMVTVDSRMDDLRSQISGLLPSASQRPPPLPHPLDGVSGSADASPVFRSMKLEVPKFDGTDPNGWAFRIEEFFDFHGTPEPIRLRIVSFHLEGKASAWY